MVSNMLLVNWFFFRRMSYRLTGQKPCESLWIKVTMVKYLVKHYCSSTGSFNADSRFCRWYKTLQQWNRDESGCTVLTADHLMFPPVTTSSTLIHWNSFISTISTQSLLGGVLTCCDKERWDHQARSPVLWHMVTLTPTHVIITLKRTQSACYL